MPHIILSITEMQQDRKNVNAYSYNNYAYIYLLSAKTVFSL